MNSIRLDCLGSKDYMRFKCFYKLVEFFMFVQTRDGRHKFGARIKGVSSK